MNRCPLGRWVNSSSTKHFAMTPPFPSTHTYTCTDVLFLSLNGLVCQHKVIYGCVWPTAFTFQRYVQHICLACCLKWFSRFACGSDTGRWLKPSENVGRIIQKEKQLPLKQTLKPSDCSNAWLHVSDSSSGSFKTCKLAEMFKTTCHVSNTNLVGSIAHNIKVSLKASYLSVQTSTLTVLFWTELQPQSPDREQLSPNAERQLRATPVTLPALSLYPQASSITYWASTAVAVMSPPTSGL